MAFDLFVPAARVRSNIPAVDPTTRQDILVVRDSVTGSLQLYTDDISTVRAFILGASNPNLEVRRANLVLYKSRIQLDADATEEAV